MSTSSAGSVTVVEPLASLQAILVAHTAPSPSPTYLGSSVTPVTYHLRVKCQYRGFSDDPIDIKWDVNRRYSEFRNLKEKIDSIHGSLQALLPEFPQKTLISADNVTLSMRCDLLETYLQSLLSVVVDGMR